MIDAFYDFEWAVAPTYDWRPLLDTAGNAIELPREGYRSLESASAIEELWNHRVTSGEQAGPVLTPVVPEGGEVRRYRPMQREHATLFQAFSEVDYESPEAIASFAKRFGLLGVPLTEQFVQVKAEGVAARYHTVAGESHLDWAFEICLMREGISLCDARSTDRRRDRLAWLFDRNLQRVQARIILTETAPPKVRLAPLNLIAAMWLQLALAVSGSKRFVRCKHCGSMFEISTEQTGFRRHREFCKASCKTLDYRKRQRLARTMTADGVPATAIAEQIETELETVKRWVKSAKAAQAPRRTRRT